MSRKAGTMLEYLVNALVSFSGPEKVRRSVSSQLKIVVIAADVLRGNNSARTEGRKGS